MKENKTEQYTLRAEEKDTLEILGLFEQELDERLEESESEVEKVKYYETFQIHEVNFKNIFITTEKDVKGNLTYHVYCGDSSNEILSIDSEGNVHVKNSELLSYLSDIDLEEIIKQNEKEPGKLKGISEKADPEELQRAIEKEDEHGNKQKQEDEEEKEDEQEEQQEENENEDEETKEIDKDLKEQGEDLQISSYRKIKDSNISKRMPEVFENGVENGIAYSNKLNRFVIISKVDGQYQLNENIEPAKMTWKTITSISPDGEQVERRVPHALMKVPGNDNKEIAVSIGQYGYVEIETVDVMPCQKRIARAVYEEGETTLKSQENKYVTRKLETEGIYYGDEIAHKKEELEQEYKVTETNLEELNDLDIEAIMEAEAKKAKMSKEGFKEYVKRADGKTLQEKIDNAHEDIEQEYMGGQRPR